MRFASDYVNRVHALLEAAAVTGQDGASLSLDAGCARVVDHLVRARAGKHTVFVVGNGGSSAIASHMHNDLVRNVGVRAQVFHDVPLLTAITNDDGYARAFCDPLALLADAGDVLVAVSSSGRSESILRAAEVARGAGACVCTLTGFDADNPLRRMGDTNFHVASHAYGHVESAHTVLSHLFTDAAAARLAQES